MCYPASNSLNNLEKYYAEEGIEYNRDDIIQWYKDEIKWKLTDEEASIFLLLLIPIVVVAILFGEEKEIKLLRYCQQCLIQDMKYFSIN